MTMRYVPLGLGDAFSALDIEAAMCSRHSFVEEE